MPVIKGLEGTFDTVASTYEKKNTVLIGFMGSGKTTVGEVLAQKLQLKVEDTDKLIEAQEGRSISDIFAKEGEGFFRELETGLLQEISAESKVCILSVGGGTPVRPENRTLLKQCGMVIYLRVRPETVYDRVKHDTQRPLLQCDDPLGKIRELMAFREDAYSECADIIIDVDEMSVEMVVEEILTRLQRRGIEDMV